MKKLIYLLIAVMLLFGCSSYKDVTFEGAILQLEEMDEEHDTSMYTEQLDRVMLNLDDVEVMLAELERMEEQLKYEKDTEETQAVKELIAFRKNMLEAELEMIKVRHIGTKGNIADGFTCRDKEYIYNTSTLIRKAVYKGADALDSLDKITGFAVTSEYIDRDKVAFDESRIDLLLSRANNGIQIGKEDGFCDKRAENAENEV